MYGSTHATNSDQGRLRIDTNTKLLWGNDSVDVQAIDFTVDTDTLFVDASTDRVGINTSTPSAALDVVGDSEFNGVVNLGSTTAPSSPINGDLWYDGTDVNIQGIVKLNSQKLLATNFIDLVDSTGWGVRVDGTNDALRPLVDNDTELGISSRRWSKVWATDADFSGNVNVGDVLNLASTTNTSANNGDIWYDGTAINAQSS